MKRNIIHTPPKQNKPTSFDLVCEQGDEDVHMEIDSLDEYPNIAGRDSILEDTEE